MNFLRLLIALLLLAGGISRLAFKDKTMEENKIFCNDINFNTSFCSNIYFSYFIIILQIILGLWLLLSDSSIPVFLALLLVFAANVLILLKYPNILGSYQEIFTYQPTIFPLALHFIIMFILMYLLFI